MSAAILPPAPGLFSITTDWPHTSCRRLPTSRAVVSVEPPGVNGTTMRTVFEGQLMPAPRARGERSGGAARLAAASATKRRRLSMDSSPPTQTARLARVLFATEFGEASGGNQCDEDGSCHLLRVLFLALPRRDCVGAGEP